MIIELYRLLAEIRGTLYLAPSNPKNQLDLFELYDDRIGALLDKLEAKMRGQNDGF